MRIVLISHPPGLNQKPDFPPVGISYLGAVAYKSGHDVLLIDSGINTIPSIVNKVRTVNPEIIGVTCWTIDRAMVWNLCNELKEAVPKAFLIIGGPHATIYPDHIFKKTHASAVVTGEGEATLLDFLISMEHGDDLREVAGLTLRNEDGTAFFTSPRLPIENIDSIPLPYYKGFEDFSFNRYGGFPLLPRPTAATISSRGCVFDCSYCASVRFWGKRWRFRSADDVLEEIGTLVEEYGIRSIFFFDDNFPVNKQRVFRICEGITNNRWDIKWSCCSHVKMANRELLKAMKNSGCVSIDFGVESGSDKILKNINKRQTSDDIEKAFDLVHESGILPRAYLMVGNPGEDESTIDETIDLIDRIKPSSSIGAAILMLLPGTPIYEGAARNGYISDEFWLENDGVPFNLQESSLEKLQTMRKRLMLSIARNKGGLSPIISYYLKNIYYEHPIFSFLRKFVPDRFR